MRNTVRKYYQIFFKLKTIKYINIANSRNIVLLIFIFTLFNSCQNIKTTLELKNNFSHSQIKDLNKLTKFFNDEYLKSDTNTFKYSFKKLFETVSYYGIDTLINQVNFHEQKRIYNSISSTFKEVWEIKKGYDKEFDSIEYIVPKYNGLFMNYLKDLSKSNPLGSYCYNSIREYGDFYHYKFSIYIDNNFEIIDFNDFNNQVIISIYYLSLVDDNERDQNLKSRRMEQLKKIQKEFDNQ